MLCTMPFLVLHRYSNIMYKRRYQFCITQDVFTRTDVIVVVCDAILNY